MSEKLSLKWNDYQPSWTKSLSELRKDTDLADVTLISDDKAKFSAHKILLSSCSNMFKFILRENTHTTNLFLYLGGVTSDNLGFILDYIYYGEVKLYQEQLDSFLESAQKLEIEGLQGNNQNCEDNSSEGHSNHQKEHMKEEKYKYQSNEEKERNIGNMDSKRHLIERKQYSRPTSNNVEKIDTGSMNSEEIKMKMRELYQKIEGVWICLSCDYETNSSSNIRRHVETHMEGLSYICTMCFKEFRLSDNSRAHIDRSHKK